ncbi:MULTISPECIES: nuclear transport factor 2 family protein [Actinomadura]|uniref:nuclear transport factor 2 family protein n=1 Tax=Actinomadura TaxID=1988 RepID=UPI0003F6E8B4|nr:MULTISPECIES: nuclear transport factor 2 family protein [Actinomadura]RSN55637.1 nuclear transport factor 2 family protein [Actinomadura sp. WAC 06369]
MSLTDDRADLTQLIYRFCTLMDEGRFEDLRSVFAEEVASKDPSGAPVRGRDAVIAGAAAAHSPGERSQHLVHNVLIDVDGDRADVTASVVVILSDDTAPEGAIAPEPKLTISSRLRYGAVRAPEGWRVSSIDGDLVWASHKQPEAAPA